MTIKIALDAMGGDFGPPVTVAAAVTALERHANLQLVLVGDAASVEKELAAGPGQGLVAAGRLELLHAPEQVEMTDKPSFALRNRRESSMRKAVDCVKQGQAAACISAGNTGALMAIARFVLKTLPGVDRPAICAAMPGLNGVTHVLDLGANVDSDAEQLFCFGVMGSVLVKAVEGKAEPRIALLNIGEEEIKGNERVKQTAALLEASPLNYVGFVEGDDLFVGNADVVVCDGFVGNVALKASEGVARLLAEIAREELTRTLYARLTALLARPSLRRLRSRADPRQYNGASLLGLRGIVVKSHGSADAVSLAHALDVAVLEVEKDVPSSISDTLQPFLDR